MKVDASEVERIAKVRESGKTSFRSHRPLSSGYEHIGVMGELAFSQLTGLPMDKSKRMTGDKGIDFILPLTVDVKTAQVARNLLVEKNKANADIYVLAGVTHGEVELIGWAFRQEVLAAQVDNGEFFKNGIVNYYIPANQLHSMDSLLKLIKI